MKSLKNISLRHTKLILASTIVLTTLAQGCASSPQQMVIAPQLQSVTTKAFQGRSAQLSVRDLRNKVHVIEISKADDAAVLVNSSSNITEVIETHFRQALSQAGLNINDNADNKLSLIINNAEIKVAQQLMKYAAKSLLTLTVKVDSSAQTFTKTYSSKLNSEGVLTADLAVLERDFNQQLAKLLLQIVNDNEIVPYLN